MDISAWQRRRRVALVVAVAGVLLASTSLVALWALAWEWRSAVAFAWISAGATASLALTIARRPRRLRARRDAVAATIDDDASATLVQVDERRATWWLGVRGFATQHLVLVDDAEGFALWDARRHGPVEVLRCSWSALETATARDDGAGVDLVPTDPADPTIHVVPSDFRDEPPQLMQTPSRDRAFAARIRARIRAVRPDAAPEPRAAGRDVDWLAPPDRSRPSR